MRRALVCVVIAVLGTSLAVLPALASSEASPTIEAYEYGAGYRYHYWLPPTAAIAPGAGVRFANPYAESKHGLKFTGGPATPSCTGIPAAAGEASGASAWHGECVFSTAGTYTFICTVHPTEMTGSISVGAGGPTTTSTSTTPTTPNTATTPGVTTTAGSTQPGSPAPPATPASPLLSSALKLAAGSHGRSVHGAVDVSSAGAGGRLEVDVLLARSALARAGSGGLARVGRLLRASLPAGLLPFTVALQPRALHALRARHRLLLSVRVILTPLRGTPLTLSSRLLLRG